MEGEEKKMNMKQAAMAYEGKSTKNISEVYEVSVNADIEEKDFTDSNGKEFSSFIATIDGDEYRVPNSVMAQLQELIGEMPKLEKFKVLRKGTGMNTTYTVVPLGV